MNIMNSNELYHHGILGMKWGVRRYRNEDGTLTKAGKRRYSKNSKIIYEQKERYKRISDRQRSLSDQYKEAANDFRSNPDKYKNAMEYQVRRFTDDPDKQRLINNVVREHYPRHLELKSKQNSRYADLIDALSTDLDSIDLATTSSRKVKRIIRNNYLKKTFEISKTEAREEYESYNEVSQLVDSIL